MELLGLLEIPNWILWTIGLLMLLYVYLTWNFDYWKKQGVPGPKPYPLIGTFYVVFKHGLGEAEGLLLRKYGTIVGAFLGRKPSIGIADPDILRQVLIKDFPNFRDRVSFETPGLLKTSVFHSGGDLWQQLRHLLTPAFTTGKLKQMLPLIDKATEHFLENIAEKCKQDQSFDMKKYSGYFTMDVISSVAFGLDINSQKNEDDQFVYHAKKIMDISLVNPTLLLILFFPSLVPYLERLGLISFNSTSEKFFSNVVKDTIKQRRQGIGVRPDMLQMMLEAEQNLSEAKEDKTNLQTADNLQKVIPKKRKTELTEENIIAQCLLFFLAGYDTTANTVSFLFYCLAINQEVQDKVVNEIHNVMGDRTEPTHEDLSKLTYMEMCINETLRQYPPVMRTERQAATDCELKGIKIKKGMMIGIPIKAMHYDPEIWPEPKKFDPERFSPEAKASRDSIYFLPFGLGPRNCIGMRLAIMEIKMLTAKCLMKYQVVPCAETQIPIQLANKFVTTAKDGVWLKMESRG